MVNNVVIQRVATSRKNGKRLNFPSIRCRLGDDDFSVSDPKCTQSTVCESFATTSNNAQRESLQGAHGLHLKHTCFIHGHLYVTL